jgi:hypothetical protein
MWRANIARLFQTLRARGASADLPVLFGETIVLAYSQKITAGTRPKPHELGNLAQEFLVKRYRI